MKAFLMNTTALRAPADEGAAGSEDAGGSAPEGAVATTKVFQVRYKDKENAVQIVTAENEKELIKLGKKHSKKYGKAQGGLVEFPEGADQNDAKAGNVLAKWSFAEGEVKTAPKAPKASNGAAKAPRKAKGDASDPLNAKSFEDMTMEERFRVRGGSKKEALLKLLAKNIGKSVKVTKMVTSVYGTDASFDKLESSINMRVNDLKKTIKDYKLPYELKREGKKEEASYGLFEA
jgi:hypothetical protein